MASPEAERLFRAIFDSSGVGHAVIGFDGKLRRVNPRFCSILGRSEQGLLGHSITQLAHPADRAELVELFRRITDHEAEVVEAEHRYVRPDGRTLWARLNVAALRDEAGNVEHLVAALHDITHYRHVDALAREREGIIARLFDASDIMMGVVEVLDAENDVRFVSANRATAVSLKCELQDLIGKTARELNSPPTEREMWLRHYRQCLREQRPIHLEVPFTRLGETRWLEATINPLSPSIVREPCACAHPGQPWDECVSCGHHLHSHCSQTPAKVCFVIRDVTAQRLHQQQLMESERRLRESEQRYALAIDGTFDGIWDWDMISGKVFYSAGYLRQLGLGPDETNGTLETFTGHCHPEDLERVIREITRHREDGVPFDTLFRMRHKDGNWRWIRARGQMVSDANGRPLRFAGAQTDITQRKQYEDALRRGEELLRQFVEHTPAAVAMFDRDLNYLLVSRRWYADYKLSEDVVGKCFYDVFPDQPRRWEAEHRRALAGEVVRREEDRLVGKDGQVTWLRWELRPWHESDGTIGGVIMFTEVITRRKLAELQLITSNQQLFYAKEELERAREEALQAKEQAMAASQMKSAFLANMSHEIRTPMTAILGYADLLLDPDADDCHRRECIDTIRHNGEHLLSIINDVLDISKIEAGKMTIERIECSPAQIVADVCCLLRMRAEQKGVKFEAHLEGPVPARILSDPTRLRQVLLNLISNAIKFTDAGSVSVVIDAPEDLVGKDLSRLVRFRVIDTGVGLAPHQQKRLFQPFSQADDSTTRRYGGTGLGLAISRRLAEMLGGTLECDSAPSRGSTFTFTAAWEERVGVPMLRHLSDALTQSSSAPGLAEPQATAAESQLTGRILLAEDGEANQRLMSFLLRRAGHEVEVAPNGEVAVEMVETARMQGQPFDLVLMDIQMPRLDGYGATAALRAAEHNLPIIALTAHAMDGDREKCLAAGCTEYLQKPIEARHLLEAVSRHLAGFRKGPERQQPTASSPPIPSSTPAADGSIRIRSRYANEDLMSELVESYVTDLPDHVACIAQLMEEERFEELWRVTHRLKGSGGGYGFDVISKQAAAAEEVLRTDSDLERIQECVNELVNLLRRVEGYDASREAARSSKRIGAGEKPQV